MTMKERIARAMCEADGLEWDDQLDPMKSSNGDDDGQQYYLAHATAALDALAEQRLIPEVWSEEDTQRLLKAHKTAMDKHGFYEMLYCVAAEGIRISQDRMIKAARGQ